MATSHSHREFEDFKDRILTQVNSQTGLVEHKYKFGDFIGKGGFAQVYICDCLDEHKRYAMKIVRKASLTKSKAKEKLLQEIDIHKSVDFPYIVKFYRHFEDEKYYYILLELCSNKSLAQLLKTRKRLTEPEVQYFALQLIAALEYLQAHNIIHRDIKLANLLLDSSLNIKLADFGLATRMINEEDRKGTLCGTPNYIAPEILADKENRSYSYEVDIWSFGVVIYTLLIGHPPFETANVEATYQKIRKVDYKFPDADILIGNNARHFIRALLHEDPSQRLTLKEMKEHPFFTASPVPPPKVLPLSVLEQPLYLPAPTPTLPTPVIQRKKMFTTFQEQAPLPTPRALTTGHAHQSRPISGQYEANHLQTQLNQVQEKEGPHLQLIESKRGAARRQAQACATTKLYHATDLVPRPFNPTYLHTLPLYKAISKALTAVLEDYTLAPHIPIASNIPWIVEVFDYTSMFGIGYLYEDLSVGVFFNDLTSIFYNHHTKIFTYYEAVSCTNYVLGTSLLPTCSGTFDNYPQTLYKKVCLLKYFRQYLTEQREKHHNKGNNVMIDPLINNPPFVIAWHLTDYAHIFVFNDGSIQMILFGGTSVFVNIQKNTVVYFGKTRSYSTLSLADACLGAKPDLVRRLVYLRNVLDGVSVQE